MFGYVRPNAADLSEEEKQRYRSFYCGLCRRLGERHGGLSRLTLTYDMTYLCLFLSSLYEPEEKAGQMRCLPHPVKPHAYVVNEITDYAADMTVALVYHQCLDDWEDERKRSRKLLADLLRKRYEEVKRIWPRQVGEIERCLHQLAQIERRRDASLDAAAACFGQLMGTIFVMKDDYWRSALRSFGSALGRFVYMSDAACDYDKDLQSGSYNPLVLAQMEPENLREGLTMILGTASTAFESLPMIADAHLLRNVLYSGVWQGYNGAMEKRKGGETNGG